VEISTKSRPKIMAFASNLAAIVTSDYSHVGVDRTAILTTDDKIERMACLRFKGLPSAIPVAFLRSRACARARIVSFPRAFGDDVIVSLLASGFLFRFLRFPTIVDTLFHGKITKRLRDEERAQHLREHNEQQGFVQDSPIDNALTQVFPKCANSECLNLGVQSKAAEGRLFCFDLWWNFSLNLNARQGDVIV